MSKREATKIRKQLEAKLQELTSRRDDLVQERSNDPLDEMQSRVDLDLTVQVINSGWQTRKAIEKALELLETGEYGICQDCGEPINPKRLKAIPWTTLCVRCQEERDEMAQAA